MREINGWNQLLDEKVQALKDLWSEKDYPYNTCITRQNRGRTLAEAIKQIRECEVRHLVEVPRIIDFNASHTDLFDSLFDEALPALYASDELLEIAYNWAMPAIVEWYQLSETRQEVVLEMLQSGIGYLDTFSYEAERSYLDMLEVEGNTSMFLRYNHEEAERDPNRPFKAWLFRRIDKKQMTAERLKHWVGKVYLELSYSTKWHYHNWKLYNLPPWLFMPQAPALPKFKHDRGSRQDQGGEVDGWEELLFLQLQSMEEEPRVYDKYLEKAPEIAVVYGVLGTGNIMPFGSTSPWNEGWKRPPFLTKTLPTIYRSKRLMKLTYNWAIPIIQKRFAKLPHHHQEIYLKALRVAEDFLKKGNEGMHRERKYLHRLRNHNCAGLDAHVDEWSWDRMPHLKKSAIKEGRTEEQWCDEGKFTYLDPEGRERGDFGKVEAFLFRRWHYDKVPISTMLLYTNRLLRDLSKVVTPVEK